MTAAANVASLSDRELVEQTKRGDATAFGMIVQRHQPRIFRLTVNMVRSSSDAEEITQEVFLRAYQAISRFDGRSEPYTWLYRIAINLSLNHLRARRSSRISGDTQDGRLEALLAERRPSMNADPHGDAARKRMYSVLCEGMDALSDSLRTTVILVCIDGRSHEDAAQILGAPSGTIAWRVHEARKKLKQFLEARGYALEGEEP